MALQSDFRQTNERTKVAKILLASGRRVGGVSNKISQRDLASLGCTDWESVHSILVSLRDKGAIGFERNKIIINRKLLQKAEDTIEN